MNELNSNRKRLENINHEIKRQSRFVESLIESIPTPIFYKDIKGTYKHINKSFEKMFGFTKSEIVGKTLYDIAPKDIAETYAKKDQELYDKPKDEQSYEYIIKNRITGKIHNTIFFKNVIFDTNDEPVGLIGAILDITEKKQDELKLIEYSEELETLNSELEERVRQEVDKVMQKEIQLFESAKLAAMGSMIGNIIHQWKQPLSVISLRASGLNYQADYFESIDSETIKAETLIMMETIDRLSEITETFRDYLKEKKELKQIVLEDKIKDSLIIAGTILKDKGISLIKNYDKEEKTLINTIPSELTEVIINIVNNAIDAIEEKKVRKGLVSIDLENKNDEYVTISIEDNAGGIPDDVLPHIFDEYFTTKTNDKGTGLGLYMSKKIVCDSLKGSLKALNTQDGAKFLISLPLQN